MDLSLLTDLLPAVLVIALVIGASRVLALTVGRSKTYNASGRFRYQTLQFLLISLGVLIALLVLPLGDTLRGQILSLIGIVLSAGIALSSTTFIGNVMAGVMLRSLRNFGAGDFIRCGEHLGRVSAIGLLHVEIQTEDRDLTTLPNLFLVTQPMTVVHEAGTIIAATVSLGYDVPRTRIEAALKAAALEAGLTDPFVQVTDLGDYSVSYRLAGMLTEVKQLISARARLRACMLDALHGDGIEIVSPSFMNTRQFQPDRDFIPEPTAAATAPATEEVVIEDLVFDKAEEAESIEELQELLVATRAELKALAASGEMEVEDAAKERTRLERRLQRLEERVAQREAEIAS